MYHLFNCISFVIFLSLYFQYFSINLGCPGSHYPPEMVSGGNGALITYVGGDSGRDPTTCTTKSVLFLV